MRDFTFHTPSTLVEAQALLDEHGENARVFAGGTALVVLMKQSLVEAEHMVSLQRLRGLDGITTQDGSLRIGALTRHRDVETSTLVRQRAPLLADVYRRVATVRIRNVATVGGGIAHADPAQDPPAGLIALDARLKLHSSREERELPLREFFRDYYETALRPDEVLTEVIVPLPSAGARSAYLKFLPRTEDDYATVAVAAVGVMEGGACTHLGVALAAAGPTPVRAAAVERELVGRTVSLQAIRRAAEAVVEDIDPLDDFRGTAAYKRDMAVVFTRRALERVLSPVA